MDKALYVAMTGASASLQAQTTVSHNLANVDTKGFKAALAGTEAEVINKELIFRMSVSYIDSVDESKVPGYDPEAQLMGELTVSEALNDE